MSGLPTQQVGPSQALAAHAGVGGAIFETDPEVEVMTVDDSDEDARDSKSSSEAGFREIEVMSFDEGHCSASPSSTIVPTELVASDLENTDLLHHCSDSPVEAESEPGEANSDSVAAAADVACAACNLEFEDVTSESSNPGMKPGNPLSCVMTVPSQLLPRQPPPTPPPPPRRPADKARPSSHPIDHVF